MTTMAAASGSESERLNSSPSQTAEMIQQSKSLLRRFLEYTDPSLLSSDGSTQHFDTPIAEWDVLYTSPASKTASEFGISPSIVVRSHPAPGKNLFSVQSVVPGVNAQQFWALMASSTNRKLWDNTVEDAGVQSWIAEAIRNDMTLEESKREEYERIAKRLSARIEVLRFGSM